VKERTVAIGSWAVKALGLRLCFPNLTKGISDSMETLLNKFEGITFYTVAAVIGINKLVCFILIQE